MSVAFEPFLTVGRQGCVVLPGRVAQQEDEITFVIGGHDENPDNPTSDSVAFSSVEAFDSQWRPLPMLSGRLNEGRYSPGATVDQHGRLFVVGGAHQPRTAITNVPRSSAEYFDTADPAGGWQMLPSLPVPLCGPSAGVLGTTLYVVGGATRYEGNYYHASANVFSLDVSGPPREWRHRAWQTGNECPKNSRRRQAAHLTLGGKLFMFGGADSATGPDQGGNSTRTIWMFDGDEFRESAAVLGYPVWGNAAASLSIPTGELNQPGPLVAVLGGHDEVRGGAPAGGVDRDHIDWFTFDGGDLRRLSASQIEHRDLPVKMCTIRYRFGAIGRHSSLIAIGGNMRASNIPDYAHLRWVEQHKISS